MTTSSDGAPARPDEEGITVADTPSTLTTPEERAANIEKALAEAEAARAAAAKSKAEAAEAKARAAKSTADAKYARLKIEDYLDDRARAAATDTENHVYRFSDPVGERSVRLCMLTLASWSRLDPGCDIEVIFTSPGGSIIDGLALFDFLRSLSNSGHTITTGCLGWAASMAGILLQAGDVRWMGSESMVMIHRAAFGASGQTFQVEDEVEWVKRIEARIVNIFTTRSGGRLTAQRIRKSWDRKDWWLFSDEALALGLVDEVR